MRYVPKQNVWGGGGGLITDVLFVLLGFGTTCPHDSWRRQRAQHDDRIQQDCRTNRR